MARVVLDQLTKVFERPGGAAIRALQQASLTVEDGELLVLVGPSGCGKTTTLRLIAGLDEPTQGTVAIDGQVMNGRPAGQREVAMVFQSPALYPHLSAYENLAFGLTLRHVPRPEIDRRVREAAELLDLNADCLARRPAELSGGQAQRIALGRALVRRPKVFLFDEPLSQLDAPLRAQMRLELAKLHARLGTTMIYVTHDQLEAMALGQRIAVMREGAIQQVDQPLSVYRHPVNRFVAGFLGFPAMNFFPGKLARRADGVWFEGQAAQDQTPTTAFDLRLPEEAAKLLQARVGKPIIVGIRPEHILAQAQPAAAPGRPELLARVELVQPMGSETCVQLVAGNHTFAALTRSSELPARGQQILCTFDLRHAQFFDPTTGVVAAEVTTR